MTIEPGSIEHLSQLISHVVAPAFLLSAVGSFTSLLSDRLVGVAQRIKELSRGIGPDVLEEEAALAIPRLRRRARLLNLAVLFAIASGIAAVTLIIGAFAAALTSVHHVWIAAVLFVVSAFFLLCALITFGLDVRAGLAGHDLH